MKKIQKIIQGNNTYQFISINYAYWDFGTIVIAFLLLLTAISSNSAVAADNIVSENQQVKLSASQIRKGSSLVSELNSQQNISLWQRISASKKSNTVAESEAGRIRDTFTANVQSGAFSNSFSVDSFLLKSKESLKANGNVEKQLFVSQTINADLHLKEQTNVLKQKQPKLFVQTDSSEILGDTFGETNKLRQELLIDPIVTLGEPPKAAPGSTAGTPSAYGASFGQAYIGGGLLFPLDEGRDRVDGSLSVGFGLGDAVKSVGLEVNANITSVGGGDSFDFGDSGGIGLKLHRYLGDGTAVAVGWSNPIKWGDVTNAKDTIYGVVTKSFALQPESLNNKLPLTISVGLGSGVFRSKGAIEAGDNSVNVFASLGLRVIPQVSLVSSWTGNRLNMGASFAPFNNTPIVINTIFTDVTSNLDTGLGFALSAGYSFRF
ncbi:hypothetical protein [Nostoc sp. UHCC 0251]|uniref:hypothetical protein n=1 Tax=Nostoc sp. UHCC 0251 TaxID=3110240 RepID=UPI002B21BF51|nr:hypothetical protein [Nostoc sp. UHCC 0251]MEA5626082.1 hypothetical protein [Nostoc sp. UHCC 0251]